jgi:ATP/ADP translocase/HEAT repeat protein
MTVWLRQFLRLQPGESRPLLYFALLGALLQGGLAIGISTADSLFLARVGVARLPVIYLLTPLVMLAYIPVYSLLITRLGIERVLQLTLAILTGGGILFAGAFLLFGEHAIPAPFYYLAKLYTALWWIALYTLYWNFVDNYFDILEAKRLYALLSGACAAGAGAGGLAVAGLSRFLPIGQLFLAWAALALLALPVVLLILRRCQSLEDVDGAEDAGRRGLRRETREMVQIVRQSRYAVLLTAVLFATLLVTAVCEFQYMTVFSTNRTEQELAGIFGRLYAGVNVVNVAFNLFFFNRLVARLGVRNTALIQPVAYVAVFLGFLVDDGMVPALLGFLAYQGLLVTVDYNNVNFLINALPAGAKKQARTFIEGLCEPAATALAGLFLLLFARNLGPGNLSLIGLGVAVIALILVLVLRGEYLRAMITNLRRGWLDFSRPLSVIMRQHPAGEIAWLADTARRGRPEEALLAIRLLWLSDRHLAADCLLDFIASPDEGRCRAAQPLIAQMLADDDHEMIRRLLAWLNRHEEPLCATMLEELGQRGLVASPDLKANLHGGHPARIRAASAATLFRSWKVEEGLAALQTLHRLLRGSPEERRAAVRALGHCGQPRYAHFLVPLLHSVDAADRREALDAITRLASRESTRLLPAILQATRDGSSDERSLALRALRKIGDPDCIASLLDACTAFSPRELREAEGVLLVIDQRGVPAVVSYLLDSSHPYQGRGLAARALARISFAQFEAVYPGLIDEEITRAYRFHTRHARLLVRVGAATPGREVLRRFYGDLPETVIDFVLELLGLGGRLPDFESVTASLRSPSAKDRADAIETIEQSCHRAVFLRLLPLLDGRARAAAVPPAEGDDDLIREACHSRFVIEAAAGLQMLWELDPGAMRAVLRERIRQADVPPELHPFVLAMLERLIARPGTPEPNLVEIVHALAGAAFFEGLRIEDLVQLAAHTTFVTVHDGTIPADVPSGPALALVLSGEAEVDGRTIRAGAMLGESALWSGGTGRPFNARRLEALMFDPTAVLELALRSPRLALALLKQKLESAHAA